MAENHPVGFQWVMEARESGGKDHSCRSALYPHLRHGGHLGSLCAPAATSSFLVRLIHYVLENNKDFREYVVHYTNASTILREDFRDTEDLDGFFFGWDAERKKYRPGNLALSRDTGEEKRG